MQEADVKDEESASADAAAPAEATATEVEPLSDITNKKTADSKDKARPPRERRERGPPADGIPSKNKVMVANLPYDLSEEKVCSSSLPTRFAFLAQANTPHCSSRSCSRLTSLLPLRSPCDPSLVS